MYRKTIKNIASIASSDVLTRSVIILFSAVVARSVEKQEFAVFSLAVTLGVYFWMLVDAGITPHSIKVTAKSKKSDWPIIIGMVYGTRLALATIFSGFVVLFLIVVPISIYEVSVYFFSLVYVLAISIFPVWFSRGIQDNTGYFQSYCLVAVMIIAALGGFYVCSLNFTQNALSAIIWRNCSWFVGAVLALFMVLKRNNIRLNYSHFKVKADTLKQTYPLGVAGLLYSLIPILPQIMLRVFDLKEELALYASAWTVQQVLLVGAGMLSSSFLPMLSKYVESKRDRIKLLKAHFSIVFFSGIVVSSLWYTQGGNVVALLFGRNYDMAIAVLPQFSVALAVVFLRKSIDVVLIVYGYYRVMIITGVLAVVYMFVGFGFVEGNDFVAMSKVYLYGEITLLVLNLVVSIKMFAR